MTPQLATKQKYKPFSIFEDRTKSLDRHELEKELRRFGVKIDNIDPIEKLRSRLADLYSHEWHLRPLL